ncbi:hypothetical protein FZEAL_10144 [Fusarium zealandicum]|uniref:Uncharacterized protein n=1 Tax=Fusarium zealandicum TaxID=1053134 RepID=A0A8H4U5G7_9HYPO|nr:hypothetical protein FZEAL_10144 [Fusarium zealandicum]
MSENCKEFSGYQWTYFLSLKEGPIRSRAELFLASVNWPTLQEYAASKRNGINCSLLPDIGLGYNHMVRIIEFMDGGRWVARLKLPPLAKSDSSEHALETTGICEFNTISLLRQKTSIPIPEIHAFEARFDCSVKAPFMLMDCLEGNVGMDLVPPAIDIPWDYNKDGSPKSAELAQKSTNQRDYVAAVKEEENRSGGNDHCLLEVLEDSRRQQLATAMRLFQNGKAGWYSKVIDQLVAEK